MDFLTKDAILAAPRQMFETVDVPEWNGQVRIRGLSGDERDRYEQSVVTIKGNTVLPKFKGARARLVAMCIVDKEGNRQFTDADSALLGELPAVGLERVYDACRRLSGLRTEDVDELVGNSNGAQNDDSISV